MDYYVPGAHVKPRGSMPQSLASKIKTLYSLQSHSHMTITISLYLFIATC